MKKLLPLILSLAALAALLPALPALGFDVTVTASPEEGGTVTGGGTFLTDPVTGGASSTTLTAVPNEGFVFLGWFEDGERITTEPTYPFPVMRDRTLEARFADISRSYNIQALTVPAAGGRVTGFGVYQSGASVTLTAAPEPGYVFEGWYENGERMHLDPPPQSFTFQVDSDRTFEARFSGSGVPADNPGDPADPNAARFTVTYDANGGEVNPPARVKTQGQPLTLDTAVRSGNWVFLGWHNERLEDNAGVAPAYPVGQPYNADADVILYAAWEMRTGTAYWPVALMAVLGVFMIILGGSLSRKRKK